MADQVYKVRDPQGNLREISGPAGASDADVIAQAQKLFGGSATPMPISPEAQKSFSSQISPYLPTARGTDVAAEIGKAPYEVGARVNDAAAKVLSAPLAAGLGAAANAGIEGVGMLVGAGLGNLANPAFQTAGKRVMQSALKPGTKDALLGKGDRAVQTLLDEGVNVSRGGVEKLRTTGSELNREAADVIANSTATVNKNDVAARLLDTEKRFTSQVDPHADLNTIQQVWTNFLQHPQLAGRTDMPIQLANELKQGTQTRLKAKYGALSDAESEAQKALAYGLRQEIERGAPTVGPINARAAEIWNALNVTERRALQQGNNNPMGLGSLVITNPAAAAAHSFDRSGVAKSLLARALYSGRIPAIAGGAAGAVLPQAFDTK